MIHDVVNQIQFFISTYTYIEHGFKNILIYSRLYYSLIREYLYLFSTREYNEWQLSKFGSLIQMEVLPVQLLVQKQKQVQKVPHDNCLTEIKTTVQ